MNNLKIKLEGIDITEFISDVPGLSFALGDYGEFPELGNINLTGDNSVNFWNTLHTNSIFHGRDWENWEVKIIDNLTDDILWEGIISDITLSDNGKKAKVQLSSKMKVFLGVNTGLYISDIKTPAEIAKDMLILWGIPYDSPSFEKSRVIHETGGLTVSANIDFSHNITLINAFKMLADIGVARMFVWKNKVYYQAYDRNADEPDVIDIPQEHIWNINNINNPKKDELKGYKIITVSATITGGDTGDKSLKTIDLSSGKPFSSYALNGAYHIGQSYLELSAKNNININMTLSHEVGLLLKPGSIIRFSCLDIIPDETDFEILKVDNSSNLYSKLEVSSL